MPERCTVRKLRKNFRHAWTIVRERLCGLDFTAFEESPRDLAEWAYPYERSSPRLLLPMLLGTPRQADDAFLDIGCGKGYVLALVEKTGLFARVGGIEISGRLCGIARRNLAKLGCRAEIHHVAAENFGGYDLYTHFYMFNPCVPQAVERIAFALAASLCRVPRRSHLFYSHPETTSPWEEWADSIEQDEARIDGYPHRLVHFALSADKAAAWLQKEGGAP